MAQVTSSATVHDVVVIGSGAGGGTVTKVLADLVIMADPQDRAALLADVIANLGHIVLEKIEQHTDSDDV